MTRLHLFYMAQANSAPQKNKVERSTEKTVVVRTLRGRVVKNTMDKTAVVAVHTTKTHPKYGKRYGSTSTYKVHDPENKTMVGDVVTFTACRPLSREKRWVIATVTSGV